MQALSVVSDAELARALGITPQSVSGARKRGEVPPAWIQACAAQTGVNAHWLFFGCGPMRLPEAADGELPSIQADCEALEAELKSEVERITAELPDDVKVVNYDVKPRKSDTTIDAVSLLWLPYSVSPSGATQPAWG